MANERSRKVSLFAPAKINLYLHVTGKRPDGYHELDSLVAFADIGDDLTVTYSDHFEFEVDGPHAGNFSAQEKDSGISSTNIVVRAASALAESAGLDPCARIHLTKNLPLAAGLGGGSSDAAAALKGLIKLWGLPPDASYLPPVLNALGADVPITFHGRSGRILGIGQIIEPVPPLPELPVVLVNPLCPCPTREVFSHFQAGYKTPSALPEEFGDIISFTGFLNRMENDLTQPALAIVPEIEECLLALGVEDGCLLNRVSGSGASCFGIFATVEESIAAAESIQSEHPGWWVKYGLIKDRL
ncbi:MAG: 4-(cytidine 5'-diphospho)-2-C-methyl-D-erythritol kinase [Alphaproteobacteria bacterium]|nr:4-(cytidine 5'-diphospho)-2-C-methyl-D-erythritol kinase [Alphaproteobacteria bacterium]